MTAQQQHEHDVAATLCAMIAATFHQAYVCAISGMSHAAILIDYDIQAAGAGQDEAVNACARSAIKAAVRAVERGIPYSVALTYLMQRVVYFIHKRLHHEQHT
jgi:hypothetical protein